jgi:thiol:disulfide interchange protein DsbC
VLNNGYIVVLFILLLPVSALAFREAGCGAGDCRDCHALSKKEAATLLQGKVSEVVDVKRSQVPGLWDVEAVNKGRKVLLYIDFSKQYLISGNIVRLASGENLTRQNFIKMFPLAMHPDAYDKAKTIICAKTGGSNDRASILLGDSLAGKSLPAPNCETDQVDKNIALAKELYISSTPTLIIPDGRVLPDYTKADKIIEAIQPR